MYLGNFPQLFILKYETRRRSCMIAIRRKEGWILNPNDKVVNAIFKRLEVTEGECPCCNPGETKEDRMCPCKEYLENDHCCCKLYLKNE